MKKLLVVLSILALATMANAALQISLNGSTEIDEITIAPSDTVVVDIYDTVGGDCTSYLDFYNESEGLYALSNARFGPEAGDDASLRLSMDHIAFPALDSMQRSMK